MKRSRGFSLIELLTVVAIIGIISAFALPAYKDYTVRGKLVDAFSSLNEIRVKQEQYFQDNRKYNSGTTTNCGATLPTPRNFTITCTTGADPAQTYTATATGSSTQGMDGFVFTITESNVKASNITASGWTNPSPNDCWARTKDGRC